MLVNVLPPVKVIPGGHSIGVLLLSHGVIVIGLAAIGEPGTRIKNPAQEAGITVGDTILRVNGEKIKNVLHLAELVHECGRQGEKVQIEYKRGDAVLVSEMEPVLCKETGRYRIGLYVRDGANGVGTLSFYHRESGRYGALGHVITDVETNQPLNVEEGTLVRAVVSGIHKGMKGLPGRRSVFSPRMRISSVILKKYRFWHLRHPLRLHRKSITRKGSLWPLLPR